MTKPPARKPVIDMARITASHRQQIERVVQIGAAIGLEQHKQHQEILKAISRNIDAMLETLDEETRKIVFTALVKVATAADAKRIRQHPCYAEGEAAKPVQGERPVQKVESGGHGKE